MLPPWGCGGAAAEAAEATAIAVEDAAAGAGQPGGQALEGGLIVGADLTRAQVRCNSQGCPRAPYSGKHSCSFLFSKTPAVQAACKRAVAGAQLPATAAPPCTFVPLLMLRMHAHAALPSIPFCSQELLARGYLSPAMGTHNKHASTHVHVAF